MSTLRYDQVRETYSDVMSEKLQLTTGSTKCDLDMIVDVLGLASVDRSSIHDVCKELQDAPTGAAVLYQLRQGWLNERSLEALEEELNTLLTARLPPWIRSRRHQVAIDLTCIPYHGKPHQQADEVRRSRAKSGTTHFHVYASAYIIRKHKRVTVAVAYYRAQESLLGVLQRLLERLDTLDIGIKRLLLDRQFYAVRVFHYLDRKPWQTILPVPARSKRLKAIRDGARRSCTCPYTMQSAQDGSITFTLHVVCRYAKGRRGKHGIDVLLFAVLGSPWTGTPQRLAQTYSRRFGIETAYRLMNKLRIRTTSRDPKLRLLFVVLAFLLQNLWLFLAWTVLAVPRRGGRYLDPTLFPLRRFRGFLREAIREVRHPVRSVSRPSLDFSKY